MLSSCCLICYRKGPVVEVSKKRKQEVKRFFQLFQRHLSRYDESKSFSCGGGDGSGAFEKLIDAGMLSCENCSKAVTSFCDLYRELKTIELKLNWNVLTLKNIMAGAQEEEGSRRVNGFKNCVNRLSIGSGGGAETDVIVEEIFRRKRELVKKCEEELQRSAFPKLVLKKCQRPRQAPVVVEQETPAQAVYQFQPNHLLKAGPASRRPPLFGTVPAHCRHKRIKTLPTSPAQLGEHQRSKEYRKEDGLTVKELECMSAAAAPTTDSGDVIKIEQLEDGEVVVIKSEPEDPFLDEGEQAEAKIEADEAAEDASDDCSEPDSDPLADSDSNDLGDHQRPSSTSAPPPPKKKKESKYSRKSIDPTTGLFKCDLCSREFKNEAYFREHFRAAHLNITIKCNLCEKEFRHRKSYLRHRQIIHLGLRHKCDKCGKEFLEQHELIKHGPLCGETGGASASLVSDKCHICQKEFTARGSLQRHLKFVHQKVRNHLCPHCGKRFGRAWVLQTHMKNHEKGQGGALAEKRMRSRVPLILKTHMCDLCGNWYKEKRELSRHLKNIHSVQGKRGRPQKAQPEVTPNPEPEPSMMMLINENDEEKVGRVNSY